MSRTMRILLLVKWDRLFVSSLGGAIFASLAFPDAVLLNLAIGFVLGGLIELAELRRAR